MSILRSWSSFFFKKFLKTTNPFFLNDYRVAARNYPRQKLEEVISILTTYDLKSKGVDVGSTTGSELLREMVIKILN